MSKQGCTALHGALSGSFLSMRVSVACFPLPWAAAVLYHLPAGRARWPQAGWGDGSMAGMKV